MTGAIVLYVRQSVARADQDDSLSLAAQEQRLRELAERRGLDVAGVYADLDVSGAAETRAGLDALLDRCRAGGITHVGVYSLSRLARDSYLFLTIMRQLDKLRIELVSAAESTDDRTILVVLSAFAERERIQISNNIAYAIRTRAGQGVITQRLPHGYVRRAGAVAIDEPAAAVVRRVFGEFASGRSTGEIAAGLARDGIPTPEPGGHWTHHNLRRMLRNRVYMGEIAISETRDPAGKPRPALIAQGNHEPIVERATWELAQRLLDAGAIVRRASDLPPPWIAGHARCAACGARLHLVNLPSKPVQPYWVFRCGSYQTASNRKQPNPCPGQPLGNWSPIEPAAREALAAALAGLLPPAEAWTRERELQGKHTADRGDALRRLIAQRQASLERAYEAYERGERTRDQWQSRRAVLAREIEAAQTELTAIPAATPLETYRLAWEASRGLGDLVRTTADPDALRAVLARLGAQALIDLRAKTVDWRFAEPFGALTGRRLP